MTEKAPEQVEAPHEAAEEEPGDAPEQVEAPDGKTEAGEAGSRDPHLELRLALAMRGGVSLAVWIGGAIAELDLARRGMRCDPDWPAGWEAEQARAQAYADLLTKLGYSDLVIDVLAGASAGGLNAVIYGFAQSVGTDLEWLRDVWEKQGDLWGLFHKQWDSSRPYRTEAVLDADHFFYRKVRDELLNQAGHPRPLLITDYLTVDLAATLQSGPPLPDRRTGADLRPRTAHFRFRRTPAHPGAFNDMPATNHDSEALSRLAYAARATSSFPGAFEPAGIFSWQPTEKNDLARGRESGDDCPENLEAVFSEIAADPTSTFDVMDGGVFDNIPIGRAVQAISDAPASNPTQRILIYLDPSPPHAGQALAAPRAFVCGRRQMRARFVRSALTALRYKQTVESSADDLRELNRMRDSVADVQTRRRLFLDGLPGVLTQINERSLQGRYRRLRVDTDAGRLCALLVAPGVGFLRALIAPPAVATALDVSNVDVVHAALAAQLGERDAYTCERDATALVAATDLFVSWLRRYQASRNEPADALASAKMATYRVRTLALYLRQRCEREAVTQAIGTSAPPPPDTRTVVDAAAVAHALWPVADRIPPSPLIDLASENGLWAALALAEDPESDFEPMTWAAAGWQALCDAINALPDCAAKQEILRKAHLPRQQERALTPSTVQRLLMLASVALGHLDTTAVPDFFAFSGDQTPLAVGELPAVVKQGRAQAIDAALAGRREPEPISDDDALNAQSKLAGNQLANFAGFLSADWRAHDWQWGRLDAGAALLSALRELHPQKQPEGLTEAQREHKARIETAFTHAETLVCQSYGALNHRKLTLADLPHGRRFALGARLGLGLQRALWPLTPRSRDPQGFRLADVPGVVALIVLRPLLVLLPLLLRPPVLAGVVVVSAGAQHWVRETTYQALGLRAATFTVMTALALILLATRVISLVLARGRWKELTPQQSGGFRPAVLPLMNRRLLSGLALGLVVLALLVARLTDWSFLAWLHDAAARATGFEAVVVLGALAAGNVAASRIGATSVVRAENDPPAGDTEGWWTTAALVVLTFGLAWLASLAYADGADSGAKVATAVAVGAVVWAAHHAWAETWWPEAMAVLSALATSWLLLDKPKLGFGPQGQFFDSSWTSSGWGPVLDVAILVVVIGLVFGAGLLSRWLPTVLGTVGNGLSLLVMLATALWSAWQLTLAWPMLDGVPTALVYGSAVASATTLFAPFRERLN